MISWTGVAPRGGRLAAVLLTAGAVAALSGCGIIPLPFTSSGPSPDDTVFNLEVGQCINYTGGDELTGITVVDCNQPHQNEIYSLPQVADGPFPGDEALATQADQLCSGQAFQDYVGVPYNVSEIYYVQASPNSTTWADGDREIICMLANADDSAITGSLRGAGR